MFEIVEGPNDNELLVTAKDSDETVNKEQQVRETKQDVVRSSVSAGPGKTTYTKAADRSPNNARRL